MKAKHTPGPWQQNQWNPFQICDADGELRGCAPVAEVTVNGTHTEALGNARLIAAAPELLTALRDLMEYAGGWDSGPDHACGRAAALLERFK